MATSVDPWRVHPEIIYMYIIEIYIYLFLEAVDDLLLLTAVHGEERGRRLVPGPEGQGEVLIE